MYSFKYHVVTICAVFLALAVGLLLGAAIGSSGVMNQATTDLVDSLSQRYSTLSSQNEKLELSTTQNAALATTFVDIWDDGQLEGRRIAIVTGAANDSSNIAQEVAGYFASAGASCAIVHVNDSDFGVADQELQAQLAALLPQGTAVDQYGNALASLLAAEWSAAPPLTTTFGGGILSSADQLSESDRAAYPVTTLLLAHGIVSIEGSFAVFGAVDGLVNLCVNEQQVTEQVADAATATSEEDQASQQVESVPTYTADAVAAQLGAAFHAKGIAVVFTQGQDASRDLMDQASRLGVAGVSSYSGPLGRYSLVRVLAGNLTGVYGPDRDTSFWYPSLA